MSAEREAERELFEVMNGLEAFRLKHAGRLTSEAQRKLEDAEIVVRDIITLDEQRRQEAWDGRVCATCKDGITGLPGSVPRCACWALLADALEQYSGLDFDSAAQLAADMWERDMGSDDRERVWSGAWLDERAWCMYCGAWQRSVRAPAGLHHHECEQRS